MRRMLDYSFLLTCLLATPAAAQSDPGSATSAAAPASTQPVNPNPTPPAVRITRAGTRIERTSTEQGRQIVKIKRANGRGSVLREAPRNWLGYRGLYGYGYGYGQGAYITPLRPPYYTQYGTRIYQRYSAYSQCMSVPYGNICRPHYGARCH